MKDWFLGLEPRERMFVSIGGVLVAIMLVWGLMISPLYGASAAVEQRLDTKRDTLAFLRRAAVELAGRADAPLAGPDLSGQSLVVIVDRSARAAGLGDALTRNQPVGEDGIRVRLENAPFESVARWLEAIDTSAGLAIESATFDRTAAAGRVNAGLVLRQRPQ
ncbi:type II secretion system protein M [Wenzhouxiangella sp. XN24]|uniref:type II secretion system protein GspM n=1 Tax=Wenzhouxiangella sp. XN24 TaxID=2713569 RepID=UPI0013EA8597|nr:type II secretion system protein M [Wenzhouxiangella sp. XN24]NGX16518.1 type II secretion system protein M [Wenzhouxiangella sp. XN24]